MTTETNRTVTTEKCDHGVSIAEDCAECRATLDRLKQHEVRHTPGPWHVDPVSERIYTIDKFSEVQVIVYELNTNEADGRLIAAAPDMSDALRRALSWLSSYPGEGAMGAYNQAVEALKKAGTYE